MMRYYNDNDPKACAWLRELIAAGCNRAAGRGGVLDGVGGNTERQAEVRWHLGTKNKGKSMSIAAAKNKRIAARRPRYLQRLVRLFRWESWDTSMNLHLIPTVTFWRHHSDDWDEDCLLRVRREMRIGVEWLFWDKSWQVWHREWRDEEARERFRANCTKG